MRLLSALGLFAAVLLGPAAGSRAVVDHGKRQAATASSTTSVFVLPTAAPAPNINSSDFDLARHFCRIYRHASVVADGKIYIDGGETYVPKNNGTFNTTGAGQWAKGINNHLVVIDLSKNFTDQDTFPYSTIHKGPDVPGSLMEHALWYSAATRKIYQIGGWWSASNTEDPGFKDLRDIPEASIWQFDIDTKTWTDADGQLALVNQPPKVDRQGAAAFCDAPSLNKSYIFEGYVMQRSDKDYIAFQEWNEFQFIEGMLQLDTSSAVKQPTLTNISVPLQMGDKDFGPRMNGAMVHVPVGKSGVLVQIGGQITVHPTPYGQGIQDAAGGNQNIPLTFVDIYDIETGFWFRQQTFGLANGIPIGRSDICAVMVPAKDNSSFNIYVVAGMDNYATHVTISDIWVLTLPSFQWILVNTLPAGFYGHTCHGIGENLVIVGGMETTTSGDIDTCASHMPATVYSLVEHNMTGVFDAEGAKRIPPVHPSIVQAVGGTADGGAYITKAKFWSDVYLQYVFDPSVPRPSYTPTYKLANGTSPDGNNGTNNPNQTPTSTGEPDSSGNKGAVIGGAVGGVLGALLLAGIVAFFVWRRRKANKTDDIHGGSGPPELPAYTQEVKYYSPENRPVGLSQTGGGGHHPFQPSELGSENHEVSEMWVPDQMMYTTTTTGRKESTVSAPTPTDTTTTTTSPRRDLSPGRQAVSPTMGYGSSVYGSARDHDDRSRVSGNTSPELR